VTWINLNGGTAKPLGIAVFPAPQRRAIYGLVLHLPQPRKPRGYAGLENSAPHTFMNIKPLNRDVASPERHQETLFFERFCFFEKHQLFTNFLVF